MCLDCDRNSTKNKHRTRGERKRCGTLQRSFIFLPHGVGHASMYFDVMPDCAWSVETPERLCTIKHRSRRRIYGTPPSLWARIISNCFAANATGSSMQQTYPQTVPSYSTPRGILFREMCRCKASGHSEAQRRERLGRLYASMNKRREHSVPCKRGNLFSETPKRNC